MMKFEKDMTKVKFFVVVGFAVAGMMASRSATADGDAEQGQKAFRQCAACHSVEKGAHRTGPSLANIWDKKAGTIEGFRRYSKALKGSGVVWDEKTLDQWLANPKHFIPGNKMAFGGIKGETERADLIAFLRRVSEEGGGTSQGKMGSSQGGMMEGMRGQDPLSLNDLGAYNQVTGMTHCADTYDVTTATGETHQFWEFNLRLKTDSSKNGPTKEMPVIIPAGMRGDRASVIFANPSEISLFIKEKC